MDKNRVVENTNEADPSAVVTVERADEGKKAVKFTLKTSVKAGVRAQAKSY